MTAAPTPDTSPGDEIDQILIDFLAPNVKHPENIDDDTTREAKDRLNRLMLTRVKAELEQPNQLLRSAYQIAKRQGYEVNWEAFTEQLRLELEREHQIIHGGSKNEADS